MITLIVLSCILVLVELCILYMTSFHVKIGLISNTKILTTAPQAIDVTAHMTPKSLQASVSLPTTFIATFHLAGLSWSLLKFCELPNVRLDQVMRVADHTYGIVQGSNVLSRFPNNPTEFIIPNSDHLITDRVITEYNQNGTCTQYRIWYDHR